MTLPPATLAQRWLALDAKAWRARNPLPHFEAMGAIERHIRDTGQAEAFDAIVMPHGFKSVMRMVG
jgi:hypothetical protein